MNKFPIFVALILIIYVRFLITRSTFQNGDFIKITTTVLSEPIQYSTSQYIKLYGLKVYLPKHPEIVYGDRLQVTGKVEGEKLKDIKFSKLQDERLKIYDMRQKIISFYKKSLPEPYASLVAGMVLGSKQMPQSFWNTLKSTGTAHVVVASGTNVTMVAGFLMGIFSSFLRRKKAIWPVLAGILVYIILSGFDAPIVRAGIMGGVAFSAQQTGRLVSAWRALVMSIFIMLLIKPEWITDLGFILSVLATSGILLLNKKLDNHFKFFPKIIREGLTTSLSAQFLVAPVIFATFGQFNILSPIINALILWTVPYIMIIGGISAVIGIISPILGQIILYLVYPLTFYFVKIVDMFNF